MTVAMLSGTPLPGAVTLAAAAATPSPAAPSGDGSTTPLEVDPEFRTRLDAAIREGLHDANTFQREHNISERTLIGDWTLLCMAFPPKSDAQDLAYLHKVADSRTDAGIARARYWGKHGLTDEWEAMLRDYTSQASPAQAKAAVKLLHDTLAMVNATTTDGKASTLRKRPFVVDPTLKLAVDRPGNNPSYPSGHTTAAYAAAIVLSHLMPDRAKEFMGMATEASWARIYGGVHFPTDVLAGARMATTMASYLVRTSGTTPILGTGGSVNPGVAGTRRRRRR